MADGQIVFEITADGKRAIASVQDVTKAIETESKKWDTATGNATETMGSQFASMAGKIGAAFSAAKIGQALLDFGKQAVDAASDLREVQNVVDVTFGEGAAQIESWAKTAQQQFGLTETQAKQFTSTLGAMMKSSGLAGDEIITMSTDLSGLAADMASFYNLDFETAFQKIRAGISGETEPLKQLGINMSVANLEAYALTQGITKSFDKMSQGEQTMLRYQYLMQATADAQGDFARTADGYANAQRRIETAISSIKTSVGTMLLDVIEPLTTGLAGFLENLTAVPEKTVLDEFADIDATTEQKLAEVTKTAEEARALVGVLQSIQAEKVENVSLTSFVEGLTGKLGDLDSAMKAASEGDYQGTIKGIADAMALKTGSDATAWNTLLTAISTKLPSAAEAVDADGNTYKDFLSTAAEAAAELGGNYPALWQTFLDTLGSESAYKALANMANGQAAADAMSSIGISSSGLDGTEQSKWSGLLGVLATAEPTKGMFGNDAKTAAGNIRTLATALSSNDPAAKQEAWASMLGTLNDNISGVAELAKQSPEDTKKWLDGLATEAAKIDPKDPAAWDDMFTSLLNGLPGLADTDVGKEFIKNLGDLATKSNSLKADSATSWTSLLNALNTADTTKGIFGADAASRVSAMADALSSGSPAEKKQAWSDMLGILSANADGVSKLTDKSADDIKGWLEGLAAGANEIDANDPEAWQGLMDALVEGLPELKGVSITDDFLSSYKNLAADSNLLNASSANNWETLLTVLNNADTTSGVFGKYAAYRIQALSNALATGDPAAKKAAWSEILAVLSSNADALSTMTDKSPDELRQWFTELSNAAPDTGENMGKWNELLTSLASAFSTLDSEGLGEDFMASLEKLAQEGDSNAFFAALQNGFMQLGDDTDMASRALKALGVDTSGVEDKQALWLKTCKELVQTIPGLSSIIDTNTGYVEGGVEAVNKYIDEWEAANKKMIATKALNQKQAALDEKFADLPGLELDMILAEKHLRERNQKLAALFEKYNLTDLYNQYGIESAAVQNALLGSASQEDRTLFYELIAGYGELQSASDKATESYNKQKEAYDEAQETLKEYQQIVDEMPGDMDKFTDSTEKATEATEQFSVESKEAEKAVKSAKSALEEIDKYYDNIYKGIEKTVEGTHDLFGSIETPADKARAQIAELEGQLASLDAKSKEAENIEIKISGAKDAIKTIEGMTRGLENQATWYKEYNRMIERARELGYSDEVLSAVADGSAESYDYLVALTDNTIQELDPRIQQLNDAYAKSGEERDKLVKDLADQTLKTDEAFQSLVQSATDAINDLNLGEEAKTALMATVQGIADGISAKIPAVQAQVAALNKILNTMGKSTTANGFVFKSNNGLVTAEPLAKGMDYVPFDNYLAALHEGESVLTAEEAKMWRAFKTSAMSSRNSVDYDALGATMRDNVRAGGNVYLDGQTVGRVISARQGDAYRAMERSGFQQ